MSLLSPQDCADDVAGLMKKNLSVGGPGLAQKLRRGGRLLPRRILKDAQFLVSSATSAKNPKMLPNVDMARVQKAHQNCVKYLRGANKSKRRTDILLSVLSGIALGVLIPAGLFTAVLVWRGYL